MLLDHAISAAAAPLHTYAVPRTADPVSASRATVNGRRLQRERRFHDEMETSVRPHQQGEIAIVPIPARTGRVRSGNVEDPLRVFEEGVHAKNLSAGPRVF